MNYQIPSLTKHKSTMKPTQTQSHSHEEIFKQITIKKPNHPPIANDIKTYNSNCILVVSITQTLPQMIQPTPQNLSCYHPKPPYHFTYKSSTKTRCWST
jgi:hypothetical protein